MAILLASLLALLTLSLGLAAVTLRCLLAIASRVQDRS